MVLSEAKLRTVIREELQQYLIEQGFLQRVGSGIKSAYQKLTGGNSKKIEPERFAGFERFNSNMSDEEIKAQEEREQQMSAVTTRSIMNADAADMLRGKYIPIYTERDINFNIQRFKNFKPEDALQTMFKHLTLSMSKRRGRNSTQREKQIYGVLVNDIEKRLNDEKQNLVKENNEKSAVSSDQEKYELEKRFLIPATLWGKTALAFSDFIFDYLIDEKELKLMDIFKTNDSLKQIYNSLRSILGMGVFNFNQFYSKRSTADLPKLKKQEKSPEAQFFGKNLDERLKKLKRRK